MVTGVPRRSRSCGSTPVIGTPGDRQRLRRCAEHQLWAARREHRPAPTPSRPFTAARTTSLATLTGPAVGDHRAAASASDRRQRFGHVQHRRPVDVPLSCHDHQRGGWSTEGTETFTILSGSTVDWHPRHGLTLVAGDAMPPTLPAGTPAGTYIIEAVYNGTTNFLVSFSDNSQTLVISAAATATAAASVSATSAPLVQTSPCTATITAPPGRSTRGPRPSRS